MPPDPNFLSRPVFPPGVKLFGNGIPERGDNGALTADVMLQMLDFFFLARYDCLDEITYRY